MEKKKLHQSKTFWTGITAIIVAAAGYFSGDIELGAALQAATTGLIGIFLRSGMLK